MPEHDLLPSLERRALLRRWRRWLTASALLALLYPMRRFLAHTVKPKPRHVTVPAPLPLSGYHMEHDFILFAPAAGPPYAVSRTCTHLGCRVHYLEEKKIIECPCHQSRFSPDGKRLAGPARSDLPRYQVEVQKNSAGGIKSYTVTLT